MGRAVVVGLFTAARIDHSAIDAQGNVSDFRQRDGRIEEVPGSNSRPNPPYACNNPPPQWHAQYGRHQQRSQQDLPFCQLFWIAAGSTAVGYAGLGLSARDQQGGAGKWSCAHAHSYRPFRPTFVSTIFWFKLAIVLAHRGIRLWRSLHFRLSDRVQPVDPLVCSRTPSRPARSSSRNRSILPETSLEHNSSTRPETWLSVRSPARSGTDGGP